MPKTQSTVSKDLLVGAGKIPVPNALGFHMNASKVEMIPLMWKFGEKIIHPKKYLP
jgi:hypothetical protein